MVSTIQFSTMNICVVAVLISAAIVIEAAPTQTPEYLMNPLLEELYKPNGEEPIVVEENRETDRERRASDDDVQISHVFCDNCHSKCYRMNLIPICRDSSCKCAVLEPRKTKELLGGSV